jgi:hypothetical protein
VLKWYVQYLSVRHDVLLYKWSNDLDRREPFLETKTRVRRHVNLLLHRLKRINFKVDTILTMSERSTWLISPKLVLQCCRLLVYCCAAAAACGLPSNNRRPACGALSGLLLPAGVAAQLPWASSPVTGCSCRVRGLAKGDEMMLLDSPWNVISDYNFFYISG